MTSPRNLGIAFALFLTIFITTHFAKFPGSLAYLMEVTQGQPILDLKASFTSAETYGRLEEFGEVGRAMYMRTMLTIDTIFPISAFAFLFLLGKFVGQRTSIKPFLAVALLSLPIGYVALDFLENLSIVAILYNYPARLDFLGANIGYLTIGKRASMFAALLVPLLLFAFTRISQFGCDRRSRTPGTERKSIRD